MSNIKILCSCTEQIFYADLDRKLPLIIEFVNVDRRNSNNFRKHVIIVNCYKRLVH